MEHKKPKISLHEQRTKLEDEIVALERLVANSEEVPTLVRLATTLNDLARVLNKLDQPWKNHRLRAHALMTRASELDPTQTHSLVPDACHVSIGPPHAVYREIEDSKCDNDHGMDVDNDSSSEDEDFDQQEYFYMLSRQQYEAILLQEPENEKVRRRLEELIAEHDEKKAG